MALNLHFLADKINAHPRWVNRFVLGALLLLYGVARWPFREVVLLRDEGELAYIGQQILNGAVPYLDAYNQKTPFTFYFLAGVQWLAGDSLAAMRIATTLYGGATLVLVYLFTRSIFGLCAATVAAAAYGLLSFHLAGIWHQSSTEFYMLLWMALALFCWREALRRSRLGLFLLAGMAAGMAYQTKQSGIVIGLFLAVEFGWRWIRESRRKNDFAAGLVAAGTVAIGFTVVGLAVLAFFGWQDAFHQYVACTWTNNQQYIGTRWTDPGRLVQLFQLVIRMVAEHSIGLWLFGAGALIAAAGKRFPAMGRSLWILLAGTGLMALLGGSPYKQYYVPLILPLSIGCGVGASWCVRVAVDRSRPTVMRFLTVLVITVAFGGPLAHNASLLSMTPQEHRRLLTITRPFGVSPVVADYLSARTSPDDCLLIVGSEPQVLFYAQRRSCSRMIMTYPLIGPYSFAGALRDEFLAALSAKRPVYVVVFLLTQSLSEFPALINTLLEPVAGELGQHYHLERVFPLSGTTAAGKRIEAIHVYRRNPIDEAPH